MRRLFVLALLAFLAGPPSLAAQSSEGRSFLFKDARARLADVRARSQPDALVLVAAERGENARVAELITGWGGTIHFRSDDVDYIRARVPTERVEELARHDAVFTLDLSDVPPPESEDDEEEDGPAEDRPWLGAADMGAVTPGDTVWPPVWSDYPLTNRYDPVSSMNGLEFRRENPTFDGRGVTTAMIDRNMDPLLPELQHALTLDGEPVHKVAAYVSVTDRVEEPDERWVPMDSVVTAEGGRIALGEEEYAAPRDGTFRLGLMPMGAEVSGLLDPDAETPDSTDFGVLWDEATDDVWVDTDRDGSFQDERPLTDFSVRPEFGVIGEDDPETDVRESIGYAIQLREDRNEVGVLLGTATHASLVIGAAVASRGEDGRFDGVAPGARVANVDEGCKGYGQTEAVIVAFQHPEVDLAFLEQCSNITRPYLIRDGRLTTTEIYSRLIERYGKTLMVPTHNYPVLGAPDDFVQARGALGIGGHESRDNYFVNAGTRVEHRHNLLVTGGYGPMGDGALKPDVIAPSNHVSTAVGFQPGRTRPGLFTLPAGYTTAGGTSTATPTATGAVMLLMSAARQTGIEHDNRRIKHAVTMGAHYIPHLPAYKQGNGVIDIARSWEILQALDTASLVDVGTRAPVRHEWSHLLPTPHEGVSIYEREGWAPGDRGTRTMTYTRTSGPAEPMTFQVGWIGNEGAFSAPGTLTLPLGEPVELPVTIEPDTAGVHSALLTLEHPEVPGGAHRSLVTVLVGEPLTAGNGFTHEKELEVPRPGMHSVFYEVPEGTGLLRIELDAPERPLGLAVAEPDTRAVSGLGRGGETGTRTVFVERPRAGVWEIRLSDTRDLQEWDWEQAKEDEPVPPTPGTLKVSAIAVDVGGAVAAMDEDGDGPAPDEATATSRMADFTGGMATLPLGAARSERRTIREREQQILEIEVPEGSTGLLVELGGVSDPDADIDVYLYDCSGDYCDREGTAANLHGDEVIHAENPAAGSWKVVVDGFRVPGGEASYDYLDVVLNPAFGSVASADVPAERKAGEAWRVLGNVWRAGALPDGREPWAGLRLEVRAGEDDARGFLLGEAPGGGAR